MHGPLKQVALITTAFFFTLQELSLGWNSSWALVFVFTATTTH